MKSRIGSLFVAAVAALIAGAAADASAAKNKLDIAQVYFEFNASGNDLGVHVFVDGEDWRALRIFSPDGSTIFEVEGRGPYAELGLTELFFEGAEPSLDEVPLETLLALFPEGKYEISGQKVDGEVIGRKATLTHAIPAAPAASAVLGSNNALTISWQAVTGTPEGFPDRRIDIAAYQVIVGEFQVTVPATVLSVSVSPEFVASLPLGEHQFEVLAIETGGNRSITEGSFVKQ